MLTSELICSSAERMRRLKYTLNDDPEEFIEQIRNHLAVVEPEYTDKRLCDVILEKIPFDLSLELANLRATKNITILTATLIRAHQLYILRAREKSKSSVTGTKIHSQNRRQPNEDNIRRKDDNVRFNNMNATRSLVRPLTFKSQKKCFKCNQVGHLQRNCPTQYLALKDKEETKEQETNQLIEVDIQPQMDYETAYTVQKEIFRKTTRKLEPFVTVTITDFEKNKIDETEALIDTGSHVNIMSKDYATKNKWKILESETIIKGVDQQKIKVVGITYGIMALAGESVGFAVKFIVVKICY